MHRNPRRVPPRFVAKALTALAVAAAFGNAGAAGLGKLTVLSALGQPLRAEIELTSVSREEAETLVAKLAPAQAFKQANIEFNPALMSLRFAVEQRGSRQVIRINSSQPVNEPYVGMLVELASSKGKLVREYTFLLDPAELRSTQMASAAAPITVSQLPAPAREAAPAAPVAEPEKARQPRKGKAQQVAAKAKSEEKSEGGKSEYHVRKGDTLGSIAGKHKYDGVSLDQMLVSIYRANPDAFIGSNMNRLKSGKVMTIPDAATAGGVSQSEARSVIVAQSGDFNQYRSKLAGMVAQAPSQATEQTAQAASGKVTAKVSEQPTAASKSVDKLKLSREKAGAAAPEKATGVVSTEDKLSQDKSIADAQARIRELEKNIKELQGLLELKSKDLAAQQKQAEAASAKPAVPETLAPVAAAPVAQAPAPAPQAAPQPVPKAKPKVTPPPPPPQTSFLDELLENNTILGGIAAAVLLLGYLIWNSIRRKRKTQEISEKFLASEPITETPNSLFGTTGGQSINTNNSIFNSSFTPSASQLDANEVDPVAEADVYIAYGREAQAIEILKDALRAQPERNAVRIKLLEIYAGQNDVLAFDALASDLYALTKGEGEDWAYAAKMGASIDPKNPLYTDVDLLEDTADKPVSIHAMTNPMEELDPDSLMAPSRLAEEKAEPAPVAPVPSADQPFDIFGAVAEQAPAENRKAIEDHELEDLLEAKPVAEAPIMPPRQDSPAAPAKPAVAADEPLDFDLSDFVTPKDKLAEVAGELTGNIEQIVAAPPPVEENLPVSPTPAPGANGAAKTLGEELNFISSEATFETPKVQAVKTAESQAVSQPAVGAQPSAPIEFDFSGINLDLGTAATGLGGSESGKEIPAVSIEMSTKLDLAVAYLEIGDKEGARELLDEVIKGGVPEQAAKAKEALARLA